MFAAVCGYGPEWGVVADGFDWPSMAIADREVRRKDALRRSVADSQRKSKEEGKNRIFFRTR